MRKPLLVLLTALALLGSVAARAEDARTLVQLPPMMRDHMMANMRDHLLTLEKVSALLAEKKFDEASELVENRLGMSSLAAHGAAHMAPFMPQPMQDIGTAMHKAASRFAIAAQDAGAKGDVGPLFSSLSAVMQNCVACHTSYRVH